MDIFLEVKCGSSLVNLNIGVSFSTWAGKRLAELVAGSKANAEVFKLPIYNSPLECPNLFGQVRSEALAPFRRLGQSILYKWYWFKDEK
jgi:hypothetical protein